MSRCQRLALIVLIATGSFTPGTPLLRPAAAQSGQNLPRRPRLPEGQDSNSALAYYQLGNNLLDRDLNKAADAYYWASRIDPGWAAPVYGRYAALLLGHSTTDVALFLANRRKALEHARFTEIDSLQYAAQLKNPFVDRRLDATIVQNWMSRVYGPEANIRDLGKVDRRFTAWAAYSRGDFRMATKVFREELEHHPEDIDLHFGQGRNFFSQGQYDSARVQVQGAMNLIRDAESDAIGWVPHAFGEYSVGFLYGVSKQYDSAMAAYERALLDDLSFHPAHRELGRTRLMLGDTTGAISEFSEAVTLAPKEAAYLHELGVLLMSTGNADSASKVFLRAVQQEPWYAAPYLPLALLYERSGFTEEATANYALFIERAPRFMDPQIAAARQRLARLAQPAP